MADGAVTVSQQRSQERLEAFGGGSPLTGGIPREFATVEVLEVGFKPASAPNLTACDAPAPSAIAKGHATA